MTKDKESREKTFFTCPVCSSVLYSDGASLFCENSHSFDIAKEGYVHLLLQNKMNSKLPGDNKDMVDARRAFLEKGYYSPLCEALCDICARLLFGCSDALMLDCGCGEGYYTERIASALRERGTDARVCGIDISKFAVKAAAKRRGTASYAAASVYSMPIESGSVSLALNVFSPLCPEELLRTVKPGGYFVYVVPAERHLWEMKSVLYDAPYENHPKDTDDYEGFERTDRIPVRYETLMESSSDIMACFGMTPYAWRSPKEGIERLKKLDSLMCTVEFDVLVFKRV